MKSLTFIMVILFSVRLIAQSTEDFSISSHGVIHYDGSGIAIDFTPGEVAVISHSNVSSGRSQDTQQPNIGYYVSATENSKEPVQVNLYPNPIFEQLDIIVSNTTNGICQICLHDVHGRLLVEQKIIPEFKGIIRINFDMKSPTTGSCFVRVMEDKKVVTTENIIKIN